jgi:hypothetical protein
MSKSSVDYLKWHPTASPIFLNHSIVEIHIGKDLLVPAGSKLISPNILNLFVMDKRNSCSISNLFLKETKVIKPIF